MLLAINGCRLLLKINKAAAYVLADTLPWSWWAWRHNGCDGGALILFREDLPFLEPSLKVVQSWSLSWSIQQVYLQPLLLMYEGTCVTRKIFVTKLYWILSKTVVWYAILKIRLPITSPHDCIFWYGVIGKNNSLSVASKAPGCAYKRL